MAGNLFSSYRRHYGYLMTITNLLQLFCSGFTISCPHIVTKYLVSPHQSLSSLSLAWPAFRCKFRQNTILGDTLEHLNEIHDNILSSNEVLRVCQAWVQAMIADFDVCPYTANSTAAGLPLAPIRYTISNARTVIEAVDDYWSEVFHLIATNEREVSTVLLVYPFMDLFRSFDKFDEFSLQLEDALTESKMNGIEFDNVFFHPEYRFIDRDGQAYLIFDEETGEPLGLSSDLLDPVSYSRRSPWPIVNILRSPFVKLAQKNMPEGRVFQKNRQRLTEVGNFLLQDMLEKKEWTDLPIIKSRLK